MFGVDFPAARDYKAVFDDIEYGAILFRESAC